jgi:hypothetical protein
MQDRPKPRYQRTVTTYTYLPLVVPLLAGGGRSGRKRSNNRDYLDQP